MTAQAEARAGGAGEGSRRGRALALGAILAGAFVARGGPVPDSNEAVYLISLLATYAPGPFAHDWTFSAGWQEHWWFNHLFGVLGLALPLEAVAWLGRLGCWAALALGWLAIGRHFRVPAWAVAFALCAWLALNQSRVAHEWMFGGFEAKPVAYASLLGSLASLLARRDDAAALLLGLSGTMHPAVGLWGGVGMGPALLARGTSLRGVLRFGALTAVAALPGAMALLPTLSGGGGAEDWRWLALVRMPHHLDPAGWPRRLLLALALQTAFGVLHAHRERERPAVRALLAFELALAAAFAGGLALRLAESWELLRFFPFRLYPLFAPILFALRLAEVVFSLRARPIAPALASAGVLALLAFGNPVSGLYDRAATTRALWREAAHPNDLERLLDWSRTTLPESAVLLAPPFADQVAWRARRAQVASWKAIRYDALPEWRERLSALAGGALPGPGDAEAALRAAYAGLDGPALLAVARRYGATHVLCESSPGWPELHVEGTWRLLAVPDATAGGVSR